RHYPYPHQPHLQPEHHHEHEYRNEDEHDEHSYEYPVHYWAKRSEKDFFEVPAIKVRQQAQTASCDSMGVILRFDEHGLLRDELSRVGYIADNYQFQFDLPIQAGGYGALEFGEMKAKNGDVYLTWRGNPTFYKCASGSFFNLYAYPIA